MLGFVHRRRDCAGGSSDSFDADLVHVQLHKLGSYTLGTKEAVACKARCELSRIGVHCVVSVGRSIDSSERVIESMKESKGGLTERCESELNLTSHVNTCASRVGWE